MFAVSYCLAVWNVVSRAAGFLLHWLPMISIRGDWSRRTAMRQYQNRERKKATRGECVRENERLYNIALSHKCTLQKYINVCNFDRKPTRHSVELNQLGTIDLAFLSLQNNILLNFFFEKISHLFSVVN